MFSSYLLNVGRTLDVVLGDQGRRTNAMSLPKGYVTNDIIDVTSVVVAIPEGVRHQIMH